MKDFLKTFAAVVCALLALGVIKFFFVLVVMISMAASTDTTTVLKDHSVYCLQLDGALSERHDVDELDKMLGDLLGDKGTTYGLNDILANIKKAKDDEHIDGIYLKGGSLAMGPASAEQIRKALQDFKESGKFVVAYAEQYGQMNYYLASVADRIMLNPQGSVAWNGLSATVEFYTRLLEKIGVEMQVVKVGTFKSAVEPFMLTSMSEANRLQTSVFYNDVWNEMKEAVAASRQLTVAELDALADSFMGIKPQEEYVTSGLIDTLCFVQDVEDVLIALTGSDDYKLVSNDEMTNLPQADDWSDNLIAVVYAEGDIVDEGGDYSNEDLIVGDDYVELFGDLADNDDVKAVVLRINSGGGSAYASEQMHHAIELLKAKKPVVVTMGDYAASGGYYMSCNASYIYALPTTLTGSIGIFGLIPSFGKLANNIGIDFDNVSTNKHSSLEQNMVLKGMNAEERAMMQAEINRGYDLFTRRCAEGRGMSQDSIKQIGEGRIWTGNAALKLGLVDALGGMDDAIKKAAELAEIEDYQLEAYPQPTDFLSSLFDDVSNYSDRRVNAQLQNVLGTEAFRTYMYFSRYAGKSHSVHARMPYSIVVE